MFNQSLMAADWNPGLGLIQLWDNTSMGILLMKLEDLWTHRSLTRRKQRRKKPKPNQNATCCSFGLFEVSTMCRLAWILPIVDALVLCEAKVFATYASVLPKKSTWQEKLSHFITLKLSVGI